MLFPRPLLARIARREVTLAFRRWRRPSVRTGGRLRTPVGELAIEAVEEVAATDIQAAEARAAGFPNREALLAKLGAGEGILYRVRFRFAGEDPRKALAAEAALSATERARIAEALQRLDRRGAWTAQWLALLSDHPGRPSRDLAAEVSLEFALFKRRMRALKELGLVESLATGYRLSPRGAAWMRGDTAR